MLCPDSVLVTGTNRGIGLEIVKQFLKLPQPPQHIFAGCRNPDAAKDLNQLAKDHSTVCILKLDMKDQDSIDRSKGIVESKLGDKGLTLLINNAGTAGGFLELDDVTREEMREQLEVNTIGPLMMVKAFLPLLQKAAGEKSSKPISCNRSAIINVSSNLGSIGLNMLIGGYAYRASKAALNMISSNLGEQLKTQGILCVSVHPGWVKTDMGGPNAVLPPDSAVLEMFKTLANLQGPESCRWYYNAQTGEKMPW